MAQNNRSRDVALILPLLGVFLLMTPFARIFDSAAPVWGIPLVALYVFAVWLGLILIALWLARRLRAGTDETAETAETGRGGPPGSGTGGA